MNIRLIIFLFTFILIVYVDGKKSLKIGRSSGAGRGSSRKTNYNAKPVPTSLSYPQPSAPKPSLSGWQEKPSKNVQVPKSKPPNSQPHSYPSNQAKPPGNGEHSYPSSPTGMSGNNQAKPAYHQENIQKTSASQNLNGQQAPNNQPAPGHSYPASPGLSGGGSGYPSQTRSESAHSQGSNYPQGTGLSGAGAGAPPPYPGPPNRQNNGGTYQNNNPANTYQHPPPPPPYSSNYGSNNGGYGGHGSNYGGYGGHGAYNPGPQVPGYFGNYGNKGFGGVSRPGGGIGTLAGVGIAGAGVGTILTGLALWNLARSTGKTHHTVIYDNRGQPVAVAPENNATSETDSILANLVNCSLSISNGNNTEVLAIPCAIATSFRPDADVKDLGSNNNSEDSTKCTVTVVNKEGREYMTTISCAVLLNTAAENNVTEPPIEIADKLNTDSVNGTMAVTSDVPLAPNQPSLNISEVPQTPASALSLTGVGGNVSDDIAKNANLKDCTPQPGTERDPLNPCFAVTHDLTVVPLQTTENYENKKDK